MRVGVTNARAWRGLDPRSATAGAVLYELRYEGWASQYKAGQAYAVFLGLWADGQRHQLVATLGRGDATAIEAMVGERELRSAVIREAVRRVSGIVWSEDASVDLLRADVEAMVHSVPALPALRQEAVVGSFNR